MEFMLRTPAFTANYPKIRTAFAELDSAEGLREMQALGYGGPDTLLTDAKFQTHCTQEFLAQDNKLRLDRRTNLIVGGMMPAEDGRPLFHSVRDWRARIGPQT